MGNGEARVPHEVVSAATGQENGPASPPHLSIGAYEAYIPVMTRALPLLLMLLAPLPGWSQEATGGSAGDGAATAGAVVDPEADGLEMPTEEVAPEDPVAAWEADHTAILPAEGIDLDAFEYVARPLVIFADSPRQPQVQEQVRLLEADLASLGLRDVVIILDTDPEARTAVRRELRPRGFGLVLVDKDGRVTFRRPAPLSVREISRAIDRTPIRQEELRNGRGGEPTE